jgi:DNA-directed RNA polymerase specialized sigma subunit
MESDKDLIKKWQDEHDTNSLLQLQSRFKGVVEATVHQFKTTGVPVPTLRATAQANLFRALNTYDPNQNTQPITHIYNYMKKVNRVASESLMSGHIPEVRNLKKATFQTALINLQDRLGYEPNIDQISDELGWNKKESARMLKELSGETSASGAEFDFYGNSKQEQSKDSILAEYLYHELDDKNKVIFEHTYGYMGKPILTNTEIAKKLKTNNMAITRAQQKMGERLASFR